MRYRSDLKQFYNSEAWNQCRLAYLQTRYQIDGGLCERCHERLGENVHHKKHLNKFNVKDPNISLASDNLELLCIPCHNDEHNRFSSQSITTCAFDSNGQPIDLRKL